MQILFDRTLLWIDIQKNFQIICKRKIEKMMENVKIQS